MKKTIIFILTTLLFLTSTFNIKAKENEEYIPNALSGILVEEDTGAILYQKDANKRLAPASMTKIMTLILIYEALENNEFTKNTELVVDEYSASMGGSQVYLKVGEKITVDEALKCICIASANDCAVLMAVTISGSEKAFVDKMNEKAKALGCNNTFFSDSTGLSSKNHYSSAYDMSIMARELIVKHPDVFTYTSVKEDYIRNNTDKPFWLVNTNKLLRSVPEIDGVKTGFCSFSGYNITLHMKKNGMGLISVVFGYESSKLRNSQSLELLMYGFKNYKVKMLVPKNTIIETIDSPLYTNKINLMTKDDIKLIVKSSDNSIGDYNYSYSIDDNKIMGKLFYKINGNTIDTDLYSNDLIKRRSFMELCLYLISNVFM